jgi:hypothetical protein
MLLLAYLLFPFFGALLLPELFAAFFAMARLTSSWERRPHQ